MFPLTLSAALAAPFEPHRVLIQTAIYSSEQAPILDELADMHGCEVDDGAALPLALHLLQDTPRLTLIGSPILVTRIAEEAQIITGPEQSDDLIELTVTPDVRDGLVSIATTLEVQHGSLHQGGQAELLVADSHSTIWRLGSLLIWLRADVVEEEDEMLALASRYHAEQERLRGYTIEKRRERYRQVETMQAACL